jgi:hypothetical protein
MDEFVSVTDDIQSGTVSESVDLDAQANRIAAELMEAMIE